MWQLPEFDPIRHFSEAQRAQVNNVTCSFLPDNAQPSHPSSGPSLCCDCCPVPYPAQTPEINIWIPCPCITYPPATENSLSQSDLILITDPKPRENPFSALTKTTFHARAFLPSLRRLRNKIGNEGVRPSDLFLSVGSAPNKRGQAGQDLPISPSQPSGKNLITKRGSTANGTCRSRSPSANGNKQV